VLTITLARAACCVFGHGRATCSRSRSPSRGGGRRDGRRRERRQPLHAPTAHAPPSRRRSGYLLLTAHRAGTSTTAPARASGPRRGADPGRSFCAASAYAPCGWLMGSSASWTERLSAGPSPSASRVSARCCAAPRGPTDSGGVQEGVTLPDALRHAARKTRSGRDGSPAGTPSSASTAGRRSRAPKRAAARAPAADATGRQRRAACSDGRCERRDRFAGVRGRAARLLGPNTPATSPRSRLSARGCALRRRCARAPRRPFRTCRRPQSWSACWQTTSSMRSCWHAVPTHADVAARVAQGGQAASWRSRWPTNARREAAVAAAGLRRKLRWSATCSSTTGCRAAEEDDRRGELGSLYYLRRSPDSACCAPTKRAVGLAHMTSQSCCT